VPRLYILALELWSCWVLQICRLNSLRFLSSREMLVLNQKYSSESPRARVEGSSLVEASRGLGLDTTMLNVSWLARRIASVGDVKRVPLVLAKL
jgi:hypothetical protein